MTKLLCRLFGHRWETYARHTERFPICLCHRCGAERILDVGP
jgi:hypothetical protein